MPDSQSESSSINYAVTLVHGTQFLGSKPKWIEEDSPLCQYLNEKFGDALAISRVKWSGRNAHGARAKAAERLKKQLNENKDKFPTAERVVICHSHGGNAALYALRDYPDANKVKVVTLAAPFLVAGKRDFGPEAWTCFFGTAILLYLVLCFLFGIELPKEYMDAQGLVAPGTPEFWNLVWQATPAFYKQDALWQAALVTLAITGTVIYWSKRVDELIDDMRLASLRRNQLLVVRAPGDEAAGILMFFQFIVWLCTRLFSEITGLGRRVALWAQELSTPKAIVYSLLGILMIVLGWLAIFGAAGDLNRPGLGGIAFPLGVAILVTVLSGVTGDPEEEENFTFITLVAGFVIFPIIPLLSICLLFFGWRIALANILLDVTVEATPIGNYETHLCRPQLNEEPDKFSAPFAHSAIYEDPKVLKLICSFISGSDSSHILT